MSDPVPSQAVIDLMAARDRARAERDYARADALRGELEAAGWRVVDGASGSRLESLLLDVERFPNPRSVVAAKPAGGISMLVNLYGWPEDGARMMVPLAGVAGVEFVFTDLGGHGIRPLDLRPPAGVRCRVLAFDEGGGHAAAWNAAARLCRGDVLIFCEQHVELDAAALAQLVDASAAPDVGLVGPFGLRAADSSRQQFVSAGPGPVDALEYLLAMRRAARERAGEFDPYYGFYRNLDLDYGHQVASAGLRVLAVDVPGVRLHQHRAWSMTGEEERDRLSRRNFRRFLDRHGPPRGAHAAEHHHHHHHQGPADHRHGGPGSNAHG